MADNGQYPSDQVKDLPAIPADLERCNVPALGQAVENVPNQWKQPVSAPVEGR